MLPIPQKLYKTVINTTSIMDIEKIKQKIDAYDEQREELVKLSRDIIRLSKKIIYALHRDDAVSADKELTNIKKSYKTLLKKSRTNPKLLYEGYFKSAVGELVEALAFDEFLKKGRLLEYDDDFVDIEYYLLGLCDLTGELVRNAINNGLNEKFDNMIQIRNFVDEFYAKMMQLDLRNGELRRKFDSIKWDLRKLDDIVYEAKIKGKCDKTDEFVEKVIR
jgi:predicted translin family RNA/ssDNA-binding protein